ncbi:hypothetical protein PF011_g12419 [Phytophthora fragariae]|uniref:Tudor domain-containing protein n=1 Tax=Phytophthora fragariae TaxID=53985 RepID=A0A6A3KG64_9STRA|nr:hypothetical protein PF011_g12419 [Phytophthora fragariae]
MAAAQAIYRVGDRVDGLYDENTDDMWYPGRIRGVHLGDAESESADTFEVLYDDGEVEMHVRPEFLRQHVPGTICVGTRVLCRYDGGEEFYPGQVSDVQENGRYTIAYDDGEVEENVPLDHILEPKEDGGGDAAEEEEEQEKASNDAVLEQEQQQEEEEEEADAGMEEAQDSPNNLADETSNGADAAQENEESVNGDGKSDEPNINEPLEHFDQPRPEPPKHNEAFDSTRQDEDHSDPTPAGVSAERAYIVESLQLLDKRLGDSSSTKSILSTLVKQMRAYPQVTADQVHERDGERLIIDALKFHQSHAVIQCYGFVLLRRLCFLCVKSTHYLLRNGIVELVIQAMNAFAEDAILQASACGALAVFTRVQSGLNILIEYQVAQLVLSTLIYHKTYSVHTRQVHYYACEVLLELCELDDLQTLNLLCGELEEDLTGDMAPISLLLFLLRQELSLDDKKACCAVGSLLMCLAASGKRAAALMLSLNGIAELSTVMARYPTEPSIQKYSAAASKQIALCSVRQSPTKRIKDTATEILREAGSLGNTPADRQPMKKSSLRGQATSVGKRKSNTTTGYGAPSYPRGAAYTSGASYRNAQGFSKVSSPYGQGTSGFGDDISTLGYPGGEFPGAATAPQQPSSLVILDGNLGMDSGVGSSNKRKQLSKEDRQSELFDAYGIQGVANSATGRPYGTKRAQLRAHLASAESPWAPPQPHGPFSSKPYSSRSEYLDHGPAYSHRDFTSSSQNRWDDNDEPHHTVYDPEWRQPRGAKRKKKNPAPRAAFQVKVENENQLRVSREARSPYPSPQRLGVATKRAAKARQKRVSAGGNSSLTGKSNNTSSESLNDYATQLFQDNASRTGAGISTSSKLTPREKDEIRERERLSFAEKLHKMIDKAKSTLANGNTTSVPAVDHSARQQKSSASSKTARRIRESSSDDKRPLSKKSRPVVNSTPKHATKEVLSPRESTETRPAKPTSGASKRQATEGQQISSGRQASVAPRAKPVASRPVIPPNAIVEQKSRSIVKSSKVATTKSADKNEAERATESITAAAPAEIVPVSSPVTDEPLQVDSDVVAMEVSPEAVDGVHVSTDTSTQQQVEPEVPSSNEAAEVEVEGAPSNVQTELKEVVDHAGPEDALSSSEPNAFEQDIATEEADVTPAPSETEIGTSLGDASLPPQEENEPDTATVVEATTDLPKTSADPPQTSVSPSEEPSALPESAEAQPSGGSATVDAMYGDVYNEFDDNGGDDEDMAVDAGTDADDNQMPVAETSDPENDVPLQGSKSGEALYDDGYDEFDEDDTPMTNGEEAEAEGVHTAGGDDNPEAEAAGETSTASVGGDSEPAPSVIEMSAEKNLPDGPAKNGSSAEGKAKDENTVHDGSVDDNDGDVGGDAPASEFAGNEPEELQELQSQTPDVDNISQQAPDELAGNTEEDSTSPDLESKPVPDPSDESNLGGGGENKPDSTVVEEGADSSDTLDGVVDAEHPDSGAQLELEPGSEAGIATLVAEPTVADNEVAEPSIQPPAAEDEAPTADIPGEPADVIAPAPDEALDAAQPQEDEDKQTKVIETGTEALVANESAPSLEQDDEESKKLSADNSVVSIQSAAYDDDNFDDEEIHQEADSNDAVSDSNPIAAPVEEVAASVDQAAEEVVDSPQDQDGETIQVADAQVDAGEANEVTPDANKEEGDSKGLTANSSELKQVQSAAYEDDDFDDAACEELSQENHTDKAEPENQTPYQEPSVDGDTEVREVNVLPEPSLSIDEAPTTSEVDEESSNEIAVENEASSEQSAVSGSDLPSESQKGNTVEALDTEMTGEVQQPDQNDSTATSDPGAVVEVPAVESDVPIMVYQDEAGENQRTAELAKYDDDAENSEAAESATAPSATDDTSASEPPDITIPADELREEEARDKPDISSQPATYDEDDFDNGGEEEQTSPSLFEDGQKDEDLKDEISIVQLASERINDEVVDTPAAETNDIDEPAVDLLEPESQEDDQQQQLAIENESIPATETAANDIADDLPLETKSELEPEVSSSEEVGDLVAADDDSNLNAPADVMSSVVVEAAPTAPLVEPEFLSATPNEQAGGEEPAQDGGLDGFDEPESAVGITPAAEEALESEPQSTNLVEPNKAEVVTDASAPEPSVEVTTENVVAEQAPDYTHGDEEFDEDLPESDPAPADVTAITINSADHLEEASQEEIQYGDADFDEGGNDTTAGKDVASESALVQDGPGEPDENAIAGTESPLPVEFTQPEESAGVVYDKPEELMDTEENAATSFPSEDAQDISEPPETTAEIAGDNDPTDDTTPGSTENAPASPSDDATIATDEKTQSEPLVSSPDATAYDEDFPDTSPENNGEVPADTSSFVEEKSVDNDDNTAADSDSSAIEAAASGVLDVVANESVQPSADVDVVPDSPPRDEGYDEGFDDDDTTPPALDSVDPVDPIPVDENTLVNADVGAPDNNFPIDTPEDIVVVESVQPRYDEGARSEPDLTVAEIVAQDEQEVKPDDCDAANSAEVEPNETHAESEVVESEAAKLAAKPEASEIGTVQLVEPDAAADSAIVESVSVETEVAESDPVDIEPEAVDLEPVEPDASELEAVESETVAAEEPEAVVPEAMTAQEPEAIEPEIIAAQEVEAAEPETIAAHAQEDVEPEIVTDKGPEAIEPEIIAAQEAETVEPETVAAAEPEAVEPEAMAAQEPEAAESETVAAEEPGLMESEVVQSELTKSDVGNLEATEAAAAESESESVEAKEPVIEDTEAEAAPEDTSQSEDAKSPTNADSTPVSEPIEPPLDEPATLEANQEELSPEVSDTANGVGQASSGSEDLPTEAVVEVEGDAVEDRNDPIVVGDNETSERIDTPQNEEYADNSASAATDAPVSEDPTDEIATEGEGGVEADTPISDTSLPVQEDADEPFYADDVDANDDPGTTDVGQNTGEVAASDTSETKEEPVTEAANPEPVDVPIDEAQSAVEEQTPIQADDYDADTPIDKPPVSARVETAPSESIQDEAVEEDARSTQHLAEATVDAPPEAPADVDVPESSEKLALEAVESQPDEIAIESPAAAATDGPATEDQYDDEDGYNDFDDQDNDGATPEAAPSVEIPTPSAAAMEAPATEDEYDEYENEDYGEEEKPVVASLPPLSTHNEPSTSAREEEIEEVADEPEEAEEEEAYANEHDDYNNEFEDDAPAPASKAPSPKKDKPTETSADEYEDDAEDDEYAEDDDVEESPPPKAAVAHSDDEMEEELGSDYADSD